MTHARWYRLRNGDWAVCGYDVDAGKHVVVEKADGTSRKVLITEVVGTLKDGRILGLPESWKSIGEHPDTDYDAWATIHSDW